MTKRSTCPPPRETRKAHPPQTGEGHDAAFLDRFVDCQPDTPWGLRNRAMLMLGYELLARRSELVALRNEDVTLRDDGTLRVLIRRSKSDPYGEGRIAFTSRATADSRGGVAGLARAGNPVALLPHLPRQGDQPGSQHHHHQKADQVRRDVCRPRARRHQRLQRAFDAGGRRPGSADHGPRHGRHHARRRLEIGECPGALSRTRGTQRLGPIVWGKRHELQGDATDFLGTTGLRLNNMIKMSAVQPLTAETIGKVGLFLAYRVNEMHDRQDQKNLVTTLRSSSPQDSSRTTTCSPSRPSTQAGAGASQTSSSMIA
jgi:hypothetical protein